LPYDENALEPVISAKTIGFHYNKHHKTYVETLNKLVEGTRFADMKLEESRARDIGKDGGEREEDLQQCRPGVEPRFLLAQPVAQSASRSGKLKQAIERDFGGLDALIEKLAEAGKDQFGSGWAWLVSKGGKLSIEKTANAIDPMAKGINCLLTVDVWEHAYYLDYQNERPKYLEAVLASCSTGILPRKTWKKRITRSARRLTLT
jgi:Fe-Mn family superoxide dismutase